MTKEELEKEAEEKYSEVDREFMDCQDEGEIFNLGYLAGAEPREKRIAELEKENAELKAQLESERDLPAIAYMQGAEKQKKKNEEQITIAKELLKQWLQTSKASSCDNINIVTDTEQFLKE